MRLLGIAVFLFIACTASPVGAKLGDDSLCDSTATQDLLKCASSRLAETDRLLDLTYRDKISSAGDRGEALRDVQRAWIRFRDAYCDEIYERSRGGNEAEIDRTFCMASLTEDWIAELGRIGTRNDDAAFFRVLRSLERAGYDRDELIDRLASTPKGNSWMRYARKNCAFLRKAGDTEVECLARLNLDRSY